MDKHIYLDNNATTCVDEEVLNAMLPYFTRYYGNASSFLTMKGREAQAGVDAAREQVAAMLGCDAQEIVFTSGSTEGINTALKGIFETYKSKGNHIVTVVTEHMAVLDTCRFLEEKGAEITFLPVDKNGLIDPALLDKSITDKTVCVCIMHVNNETGVMQDVKEISRITHAKNTIFVCDATQSPGKTDIKMSEMGADVICISAHKMYGPKGAGALYIKRKNPRVALGALIHGGGQERGLRSGTLNVPGIVGLGKACELIHQDKNDVKRIKEMRDEFEKELIATGKISINGELAERAVNVSNIFLHEVSAKKLFQTLLNVSFSAGSACSTGKTTESHVLGAMGLSHQEILNSVRFSFGKYNTMEEVKYVSGKIKSIINSQTSHE